MSDERANLRSVFLAEAWETLDGLRAVAPAFRGLAGASGEDLDGIAIAAHRLKGAAGLYDLPRVATIGGRLERLAGGATVGETDEVRADAVEDYLALLQHLLDQIPVAGHDADDGAISMLAERHGYLEAAPRQVDPRVTRMITQLRAFRQGGAEVLEYFLPEAGDHLDVIDDALLALERSGQSEEEIDRLFRAVHTLKGAAYVVGCDPIGDLSHELEDRLVELRDGRESLTEESLQALFFGAGGLRALAAALGGREVEVAPRLARALAGLSGAPAEDEEVDLRPAPAPEPIAPLPVAVPPSTAAPDAPLPTIRVRLDRLERLMNGVGELVLTRARLERRLARLESLGEDLSFSRTRMTDAVREFEQRHAFTTMAGQEGEGGEREPAPRLAATDLATVFSELEFDRYDDFNLFARRAAEISADLSEVQQQVLLSIRGLVEESTTLQQLTRALRGEITRARLLPLTPLYVRLERQARELGMALEKPVDLVTEGGTVELDSRVVHDLADVLLHLVTNALTHGLESETERIALGKPPRGIVRVRAEQQGSRIMLEVEDDGRGIDIAAVRREAIERGLLTPEAAGLLGEAEAIGLIFRPGFSTAGVVSASAGRGVGLDAVRSKLHGLRGEVRVATTPGHGTRFRVTLPLTVAISDALILRSGGQTFGLPLSVVKEIRHIDATEFGAEGEARYRGPDGELQPAFRLEDLLGLASLAAPGPRPLVVVAAGERQYGLAVDELVGKEEAVFKPLGRFLDGTGPYGGAMLTGAGEIVLILDPLLLRGYRAAGASQETRSAAPAHPGAGKPRVLLVDDSISVRRVVAGMLERGGFEVETATDGIEALERLSGDPVDLVLTDLEMPRLNGFELLQDIRRRGATRSLPVVVLTSRSGAKHESLARQLGASQFVAKPVQEDALLAMLQSLLFAAPAGAAP